MGLNIPESLAWRRLFFAFVASSFGDQFTRVALLPKAGATGGHLTWLVGIALAQTIPGMVVSPFGGYLADRASRVTYLVLADAARAVLLVWISAIRSLPLIVVAAGAIAVCNSIFRPIDAALEADLLPRADILRANVLRSSAAQLLMICGPAMAGLILIWLPASKVLLIDALSFAASAIVIATLRTGSLPHRSLEEPPSAERALRRVMRYVRSRGDLRTLFLTAGLVTALLSIQNPLFYGFVQQSLLKSGAVYGLFMTALGVGGLLASFLMAKQDGRITVQIILATLIFDGLALLGFTYSTNIALSACLMAALGAIGTVFAIAVRAYLQLNVLAELRGRVIGWFMGLQSPIAAASLTIGLYVAAAAPASLILRISGAVEVIVAVLVLGGWYCTLGKADKKVRDLRA